jgi:hypothetical protein
MFKRLAYLAALQGRQAIALGLQQYIKWQSILFRAWVRSLQNRNCYKVVTTRELKSSQKSDTVFIFGSGYSLNEISSDEWRHFEKHDTLGLSGFIYQNWVRTDYHLIRGWVEAKAGALNWRGHTQDFANVLNANPHFKETILIMQGEYLAQFCNSLIGYGFLRPNTRIFRYKTARGSKIPSRRLEDGLSHTIGTLSDAVNFAYCLGWKHIVLVGVDLYDSRYFWLKDEETTALDATTGMLVPSKVNVRGLTYDQKHNTAKNGIVETMAHWNETFQKDGVMLSVYNPRSLLCDVLPLYSKS